MLDMSKTFDTVPHERLCCNLAHDGIWDTIFKLIRSFLLGRTQKVILNGQTSNSTHVLSRVPQGSILKPLLFIMYINDYPNNLASNLKLFTLTMYCFAELSILLLARILSKMTWMPFNIEPLCS